MSHGQKFQALVLLTVLLSILVWVYEAFPEIRGVLIFVTMTAIALPHMGRARGGNP